MAAADAGKTPAQLLREAAERRAQTTKAITEAVGKGYQPPAGTLPAPPAAAPPRSS